MLNKKYRRPRITENRGPSCQACSGIIAGEMRSSVCAVRKAFSVRNEAKEGGFKKNFVPILYQERQTTKKDFGTNSVSP